MNEATAAVAPEVSLFRQNARIIRQAVEVNLEGFSHEESLLCPQPAGSCANWVLGHLTHSYEQTLPHLGEEPVLGEGALDRYQRGSAPLVDGTEAIALEELMRTFAEASDRILSGLATVTPQALARTHSYFAGKSDTTLAKFLNFIFFHQAYHAGQLGLLRRLAGKEGAIR